MTVTDTIALIDISIQHLVTAVCIVAILSLGVTQYLKKLFPHCGKIAGPITCVIFGIINTRFVPPEWTAVLDIVFGGFALVQICHDTIIRSLPKLVERVLLGNFKAGEEKGGT